VIVTPAYSLYSPYGATRTAKYDEMAARERRLVFALFGLEDGTPVRIWMQPIDGPTEAESGEPLPVLLVPKDRLLGRANTDGVILLAVAPIQRVRMGDGALEVVIEDHSIEGRFRHELAHVAVDRLDLGPTPSWLREGAAETVEAFEPGEDSLERRPAEGLIRAAAALPRDQRSLARLVDWRQELPLTDDDVRERILGTALFEFLLDDDEPFVDSVRRIAALSRSDLLAEEDAWQIWLDARGAVEAGDRASSE